MSTPVDREPEIASRVETVPVAGDVCLAFPRGRHAAFRRRPARVDVLVPVRNGGPNLERCVQSVLRQTFADLHLVLVDNASSDDTFARCCAIAGADERVVVYQNARDLGRVPNWNRCLDLACAEFEKLLMVNDVLLPEFVADLLGAFEAQPSAVMARASLSLLEPGGTVRFSPYFAESTFLPADLARKVSLARDNVAGCPAAQLVRRSAVEANRLRFDETLSWAADYDFSTRLFEHGGLAYVRKALFLFDASAPRFFQASDLSVRLRDECAVRVNGARSGRGLDAAAVAAIGARLTAVHASFAAQATSAELKAELDRIHREAQAALPLAVPPARDANAGAIAIVGPPREPGRERGGAPRVSVVIPCYKQANFLPEAVESLVAQTFTDWECIVVDDGSPDDASEVARALAAKYAPRAIRVIRQENRGLSEARNTGIRASMGRYVLPFDSDDRLAPTMLARLVAILDDKPEVAIAFTHAQCFGVQTGVWQCGPFTVDRLREANRIPYCSLYRRGVWNAVGGYNPNLDAYEDWDFWIGAVERGFRAEGTGEPLFLYRTKAVSMLTQAEARKKYLAARIVLNHPGLFTPDQETAARATLPEAVGARRPRWAPTVSVVVLRQRGGSAFARTVQSVLGQSFQDFEVIVVGEGGGGEAELGEIDRGGRARYLRAAPGEGKPAARNAALALARGRFVAYADEGDVLYPEHLETLTRAAAEHGADLVYGDAHRAGDGRSPAAAGRPNALALSAHAEGDVYTPATRLPIICILHERSLLERVGGFDESLGALEEWDFQIRLLAGARAVHLARSVGEAAAGADHALAAKVPGGKEMLAAMGAAIRSKHDALFNAAETRRQERYAAEVEKAETLVRAGDVPAGIAVMETCVRRMPYWAPAHDRLATMYRSAGKLPEALASVVAALELEPTSAAIWQNAKSIEQAVEALRPARAAR